MMKRFAVAFLANIFAIGLLGAAVSAGDLRIENAWARATPGALKSGAAYVTLTNTGSEPDRLVAVATPVAGHAATHAHAMEGGVAKMRPLASLPLEPGETVTFAPGGLHIMLMPLTAPLKEGETFPLTLTFERAGAMTVEVPVLPLTALGPSDHKSHTQ